MGIQWRLVPLGQICKEEKVHMSGLSPWGALLPAGKSAETDRRAGEA